MGHGLHTEDAEGNKPRKRRRRQTLEMTETSGTDMEPVVFLTKDDLSHFLSIKPYLSEKAQGIVDLLDEMHRTGGKLEAQSLVRLMGLFGGGGTSGLNALVSMAGLGGGKLDPGLLTNLLGNLGQNTPKP